MPVPFGFSVGDFVAVIGLIVKICQAFDDDSDVLRDFIEVRSELQAFGDLVDQLQKSILGRTAISDQNATKVKNVLDSCKQALENVQAFVHSYKEAKSISRRISWAIFGKSKLEPFRRKIQHNMTVLGLIQHDLIG